FNRESGKNPFLLHEELKDHMQKHVGILRTQAVLEEGLVGIEKIRGEVATIKVEDNRHFNAAWHEAFDMRNMMVCAEAMCRAAMLRKESRGAHAREDFEKMDDAHFGKVSIVSKRHSALGSMETKEIPLPEVPQEIKDVLDAKGES
ncbi:MAG: fumarate reductase/succinate dehydrogenase flavoprotein subunit, partial [Polyangiaceae bacterium]